MKALTSTFNKKLNNQQLPILLVEDYPANILLATIWLEQLGYNYEVVNNGQQAVDAYQPGKYFAILMDIELPVMDGYEATKKIREMERLKGWEREPIIAMTAHDIDEGRTERCRAGMDDYILKPLNHLVLLDKLNSF